MELKDRIATFRKNTYNKFWWWRRFQPRQTLHKYRRLDERIPNGDFEVSDYYWQLQYENVLEQEAIDKEPEPLSTIGLARVTTEFAPTSMSPVAMLPVKLTPVNV